MVESTTSATLSEISASTTISQNLQTVSVGGNLSVAARDVVQHYHTIICHHERSAGRADDAELEERRRDIKGLKLLVLLDVILSFVAKLVAGVEKVVKEAVGTMKSDAEHDLDDTELHPQGGHSDISSDSK
jgi:hypothetical protein